MRVCTGCSLLFSLSQCQFAGNRSFSLSLPLSQEPVPWLVFSGLRAPHLKCIFVPPQGSCVMPRLQSSGVSVACSLVRLLLLKNAGGLPTPVGHASAAINQPDDPARRLYLVYFDSCSPLPLGEGSAAGVRAVLAHLFTVRSSPVLQFRRSVVQVWFLVLQPIF